MSEPSTYKQLFENPDPILQPEQRLWIHVVMQAVIDAASTNPKVKVEVVEWLATEDFDEVCGMAAMSPRYVRHEINAVLAAETVAKAFRRAMSFRFLVRSFLEDNSGEVEKERDNLRDTLTDGE